jgi:hypothetical protein
MFAFGQVELHTTCPSDKWTKKLLLNLKFVCVVFCRFLFVFLSCSHCVVCPSSFCGFWLPPWYLVVIVLSVLRFTASDYLLGILWSLCYLSFELRLLITPLVSFSHCVVCPSSFCGFWLPPWYLVVIMLSVLRFTASDYLLGILDLRLLITSLVSSIYCFCLLPCYLWFTAFDYLLVILDLRLLITSLVS